MKIPLKHKLFITGFVVAQIVSVGHGWLKNSPSTIVLESDKPVTSETITVHAEEPSKPILSRLDMIVLHIREKFGEDAQRMIDIARCESGLRENATNMNKDGSRDRGLLQINDRYQAWVTDECAYDGFCAVDAAYKIYLKREKTFSAWVCDRKI